MYTGSCLCRIAIIRQIRTVRFVDLANNASKRADVLALQDTMEILSQGWGRGLLGFIGFCWGLALCCFLLAINAPWATGMDAATVGAELEGTWRGLMVACVVVFSFVPVLVAQDVATTSSCCDILMAEINQARQRLGPEANEVITWLESSLNNLVRTLLGSVALPL